MQVKRGRERSDDYVVLLSIDLLNMMLSEQDVCVSAKCAIEFIGFVVINVNTIHGMNEYR